MDDDDMGAFWRDVRAVRQAKRASNRASSAERLREAGIAFDERNAGAHLIVATAVGAVDFWPGTGLWIVRGSTHQRYGVRQLIAYCQAPRGTA